LVQWELEVRKVIVDDVELGYMELGRGEPLVMIMGRQGPMDLWDPRFVGKLAKERHVVMFDNRGIGFSSVSEKRFGIELFADDTAGLIGALGLRKADILGWSMGASIALETGLRHPEKVRKLVLYAGSAGGDGSVPASPVIEDLRAKEGVGTEEIVRSMFPESWNAAHPDIWEYYPKIRRPTPPEVLVWQERADENYKGCFDRLDKLESPALIINGIDDLECPAENALVLEEEIREAEVYIIEGAGHGVMYQSPDIMSRAVLDFLR